jgi:hypothetical protein
MSKKTQELVESNESNVVQHPATQEDAVMGMLQTALEKGVDADSLEKLLNMQERILDRQAEQAYTVSMVDVQKRMPKIYKNRRNDQTSSNYADLEAIIPVITPIYTDEGFSMSFGTADSPAECHVRVTCDVMHKDGHSKHYFTDVPLDNVGIKGSPNKTKVHGSGSAISYGRRYLTALIFNLITGDDDGNAASVVEYISDEQLGILRDLINATETEEDHFSQKVCKVESLDLLPTSKYDHAHKLLTDKQAAMK